MFNNKYEKNMEIEKIIIDKEVANGTYIITTDNGKEITIVCKDGVLQSVK